MCQMLIQAPYLFYGLAMAAIGIAILPILFALHADFMTLAVFPTLRISAVIVACLLASSGTSDELADKLCDGPANRVYPMDLHMGYSNEQDIQLNAITISNGLVRFDVIFHNSTGSPLELSCPYTEEAFYNGSPSIEFEDNQFATLVDHYCRHHHGESWTIQSGHTFADWAIFETTWRFRRPFDLNWYGHALAGIELPKN